MRSVTLWRTFQGAAPEEELLKKKIIIIRTLSKTPELPVAKTSKKKTLQIVILDMLRTPVFLLTRFSFG